MTRIGMALALVFASAACSGPGPETEDLCANSFCSVGSRCEPSTGECVPINPNTDAGEEPADAGEDPPDAGEDPVDAGEDPVDAGEDPVDAGEDPADAGEDPVDAGEEPADAGEEPADAGEDPVDAGEDPVDAGEDPVDAGEEPVDAGEEPVDAGEEPVDAGEDPVDAGEVACAPGCSGETPICDEETDTCVTCTATAGCSGEASLCDTSVAGGQCVTCTATEGCSGDTPLCDTSVAGGQCVTCTATEGCSGETPICDTSVAGGQCVTCTSTEGCSGETPACDTSVAGGACVACVDDETCEGDTPVCLVASNVCVGCIDDAGCSNPTPVCEEYACRGCADDAECAVTAFCEESGACRPLPDTCALALDVALPSPVGEVSFVADTTHMMDDVNGTCSLGGGAELVYRLPLAQAADVTVTVAPASGSAANPVFYLREGTCAGGTELACQNTAGEPAATEKATLLNRSGDLFLFVETAGATRGAVDVTIKLEPPTLPPPNDTCATAGEGLLIFDEHGHAEATGSTLLATNGNPKTGCSKTARDTGHDVIHSFELEEVMDVSVRLEASAGSTLEPVVGVWPMASCETGTLTTELACQGDINRPTQVSGVLLRDLQPGTYAVLVDGAGGTAGRYRLSLDLSAPAAPPANEDCGTAEELVFVDDIATVSGDTWAAANHYSNISSPSCSPSARSQGKDVFYKFTTTTTRNLIAHLVPTGAAPTYKPVLALRPFAGCANGASERSCGYQSSPTALELRAPNLPAGTWYLQVDSLGADGAGPFELDVLLSDPPPLAANDDCSAPEELVFSGGRATTSGNLLAATNVGGTLSCSTGAVNNGADLVYEYTLDATSDVSIAVVPDEVSSAGLAPVLSVHNACETAAGTELVCRAVTGGKVVERPLAAQEPGTYWIWVDASGAAAGDFTLDVQTGSVTNDDCSAAQALTLDKKVVGHTNFATNDYTSYACTGCSSLAGPDLVYAYTEQTGGQRTVTVRPSQLLEASILRLEGGCAPEKAVAGVNAKPQGTAETMTFTAVAGTTYWFVVDGPDQTYGRGAFEIVVQ